MTVLAVDLAAKFSAVCVMDDAYHVLQEWDSFGLTESAFIGSLLEPFLVNVVVPEAIVIEDLPHRLPQTSTVKAVARLQGRIYDRFERVSLHELMVFCSPATWRNTMPILRRKGLGPQAVIDVAATYGYQPPLDDLKVRAKGKGGLTLARKVASDYCSAYLIARWAVDQRRRFDRYDVAGTSRYGQQQKRTEPGETHA